MKNKRLKRLSLSFLIIIVFFALFILINNYSLCTTFSVYKSDKAQNKVRVVVISDLHGKSFGTNNRMLSRKILKLKPDIIIMAGDMFGENADSKAILGLTKSLTEKCGNVYYSFGNHESRDIENRDYMAQTMSDAGAIVLNNKKITYKKDNNNINIYGLELPLYFYSGYDNDGNLMYDLEKEKINSLIGESTDDIDILIAHNPIYFESYADWGANIIVSGHNHGGVVRLPWIGGLASPNGDTGNIHYDCGEYNNGDCTMYLSRGLGEWAGPFRIFNIPEIYVIDISN